MESWSDEKIRTAFNDELERLLYNPNPEDRSRAQAELMRRQTPEPRLKPSESSIQSTTSTEAALQQPAFDPKTDVSADAKYIAGRIVTHLWIIFVLLPFIIVLLWELLK